MGRGLEKSIYFTKRKIRTLNKDITRGMFGKFVFSFKSSYAKLVLYFLIYLDEELFPHMF